MNLHVRYDAIALLLVNWRVNLHAITKIRSEEGAYD